MQAQARVVIIGGGVIGCSVLYHLTKLGWRDVVLLERKELTAGSTWHAAGGFHTINGNANISRLQAYTCGIYREIQELSGQDVGAHYVGGLLVAATPARFEFLRAEHARHQVLGIESELIGPDEVKRLCPIIDVGDVLGAIFDPLEGYLDPSGATHAYAGAARAQGATIHRHTMVTGLERLPGGDWKVFTDKGEIIAEHVVNAAGLWAREVGRMAGVTLPLVPMEHHYLITEDIPELAAHGREIPAVADLDGRLYLRQERGGILLGVYEKNATPWAVPGTPWDYAEDELLVPDLDRLGDDLTHGFARFPAVAEAGIKRIVNGPFTFSPDGNPLVGPVAGLPGYWVAAGCMAGFVQGGGVGRSLAEWIVEGQPTIDVFGMDIARFDPKMPEANMIARAREFYSRRFDIPYPNESWPVGRPLKTTPLYEAQQAKNAAFIASYGIEAPAYFAPAGMPASETPTFYRSDAFDTVGEECRAVRDHVGVLDYSAVAKFAISGPDAERFLRRVVASAMPEVGRSMSGLLLSATGRMVGDLNLARLSANRYLLTAATFTQTLYARWFEQHRGDLDIAIENVSETLAGLLLVGPNAPRLIDALTAHHALGSALRDGDIVEAEIGYAPCHVVRTDKLGVPGFELLTPPAYLTTLYRQLEAAGTAFEIRDIGVRAFATLAMESAPGVMLREISQDRSPAECGYAHLIDFDRDDYLGAAPARAAFAATPQHRLVGLRIETDGADPAGDEPVWSGTTYVGATSSGCYGHSVGYSIALAFIAQTHLDAPLEVSVMGVRRPARIVAVPFVPD